MYLFSVTRDNKHTKSIRKIFLRYKKIIAFLLSISLSKYF